MTHSISNGVLSLEVDSLGAELRSLKLNERELLWQGDERFWTGRAPVLFPIVCGLRNDLYTLHGHSYRMPPHGFAKDKHFSLASREADQISFVLRDDEETRAMYPFRFTFTVGYALDGTSLRQEYIVQNDGDEALAFSLGVHTALNCPLNAGECFEEYQIRFPFPITIDRRVKKDNLMTTRTRPVLRNADVLPLDYALFDEAAVALVGMPVKSLELSNTKGSYRACYRFDDYADLGIWTMRGAPFICVEPWNGYDSCVDGVDDLLQKPGILLLQPGMTRSFASTIEFLVQ